MKVVIVGTDCISNNLSSKSEAPKSVLALVKEPAFAKVIISPAAKLCAPEVVIVTVADPLVVVIFAPVEKLSVSKGVMS